MDIKQEKKVIEDEQFDVNSADGIFGPLLFPFINSTYTLATETACTFFLFDQNKKDEILKLISTERAAERRKTTRLNADYRHSISNVNRYVKIIK